MNTTDIREIIDISAVISAKESMAKCLTHVTGKTETDIKLKQEFYSARDIIREEHCKAIVQNVYSNSLRMLLTKTFSQPRESRELSINYILETKESEIIETKAPRTQAMVYAANRLLRLEAEKNKYSNMPQATAEELDLSFKNEIENGINRYLHIPKNCALDLIVTHESEGWQRVFCSQIMRYMEKETYAVNHTPFDSTRWESIMAYPITEKMAVNGGIEDIETLVGLAAIERNAKNEHTLIAAWVHPFCRRLSFFDATWSELIEIYGDTEIKTPFMTDDLRDFFSGYQAAWKNGFRRVDDKYFSFD